MLNFRDSIKSPPPGVPIGYTRNLEHEAKKSKAGTQQTSPLVLLQLVTFTKASLSAPPHQTAATEGNMRRMKSFSSGPNAAG